MVEKLFVHAVKNAIDPREETDPETRTVSNRDVIDHREEADQDPEARTVSRRDVQEETDADRVEVEPKISPLILVNLNLGIVAFPIILN